MKPKKRQPLDFTGIPVEPPVEDVDRSAGAKAEPDADAPVSVEGGRESLLDSLLLGDDASEADALAAIDRLSAEPAARLLSQVPPELRVFVSGFAPLAEREHVAVALPYALLIH